MRNRFTALIIIDLVFSLIIGIIPSKADIIPELSKDSLNFGNVASCERPRDTVVVRNPSTSTVNFKLLIGEKITGANLSSFRIINPKLKDLDLPPYDGSNAVIYVVEFNPSVGTTGPKVAFLEIPTDLPNMPLMKIPIIGFSEKINYVLNPDPVNFGDIPTSTNFNVGFSLEVQSNLFVHISKIEKSKNEVTLDLTGFDYNLPPSDPQRTIGVNINLNTSGNFSDTIKVYIDLPCDTVLSIPVLANGVPSAITAVLNYDFGLVSNCETKDTLVTLTFSGSGSGKIESVGVINGSLPNLYSVSFQSTLPITLNSSNPTTKMTITYTGNGIDQGNASVTIPVNITINANSSTINFTSTAEVAEPTLTSDKTDLNYGTIFAFTSKSLDLTLSNNSKFDINLSSYKFTGNYPALFDFNPTFVPKLIKKGTQEPLTIFFNPVIPKITATGQLVLYYTSNGCYDSIVVSVEGSTFDSGGLKFSFNNELLYEVDPNSSTFSLPITMRPSLGAVLLNDSLGVEVTFPRSVFFPEEVLSSNKVRIDNNQIVGNSRVFYFTVFFNNSTIQPDSETKFAEIKGIPLLGDIKDSKFDLTKVEFKSGSKLVTVDSLTGTIVRLKICDKGGERLLKVTQVPASGIIKIKNSNDNDILISCFLLEKGMNKISLIDYNGNILNSQRFYSSHNSENEIHFETSKLSNSVYFILLETVSEKFILKILR